MNARERIKREQNEGKTIVERIKEQKGAVSAGKLFNSGVCRIGKTVFDLVSQNATNNKKAAEEKGNAARTVLLAKVKKADEIKALGKPYASLNNEQIKLLLAPLKRKGDLAIPTRKADMLLRLTEWEARGPIVVEEEVAMVVAEAAVALRREDLTIDQQSDIQGDFESV